MDSLGVACRAESHSESGSDTLLTCVCTVQLREGRIRGAPQCPPTTLLVGQLSSSFSCTRAGPMTPARLLSYSSCARSPAACCTSPLQVRRAQVCECCVRWQASNQCCCQLGPVWLISGGWGATAAVSQALLRFCLSHKCIACTPMGTESCIGGCSHCGRRDCLLQCSTTWLEDTEASAGALLVAGFLHCLLRSMASRP